MDPAISVNVVSFKPLSERRGVGVRRNQATV